MKTSSTKLRHIVLFGFRPETDAAQIEAVVERFSALQNLVPGIEAFEWGVNCSPEGLAHGHTHGFTLTFGSERDRDGYLVHPDHHAFVQFVGPFLEKSLVVDYWTA